MNRKRKTEKLKQKLTDAQDGLLSVEEKARLKEEVMAFDARLWEDHLWYVEQQKNQGVFYELAAMSDIPPDEGAIRRFYKLRERMSEQGREVEVLVWSWFRRYVLTLGLFIMVLLAGLQYDKYRTGEPDTREQMEAFLGLDSEEFVELNHWLYQEF